MGGETRLGSDSAGQGGSDIELVSVQNAQLFLLDHHESVAMQRGDFKLVLTKQLHSPLAAVVAIVKDVEWPVGDDGAVLKLARGCYSFELPGFSYGLLLDSSSATPPSTSSPSSSSSSHEQLELFLHKYCAFEDRSEVAGAKLRSGDEAAAVEFWNDFAGRVKTTSSATGDVAKKSTGADGQLSPRMMKRVQQARRLSAISKLFSRALLKGAISNLRHVTNTARSVHRARSPDEAVASVDAFSKVAQAVESASAARKSLAELGENRQQDHHRQQQQQPSIQTAWTLNNCGLQLLIGAVAASAALNFSPSPSSSLSSSSCKQRTSEQRPPLPVSSPFHQPANRGFHPVPPHDA